MPRLKPGERHPGAGRIKGTPNKDTKTLKELIAAACGADWDPVVEMALIAKTGLMDEYQPDPLTGVPIKTGNQLIADPKTRVLCRKEVSEYIHPKRRAIEVSDPNGDPLSVGVFLNVAFDEPDPGTPDA